MIQEPYYLQPQPGDDPYEISKITKVDDGGGGVTMESGWSIGVTIQDESSKYAGKVIREKRVPQVGEYMALWGRGTGYKIRGMAFGPEHNPLEYVVFYRPEDEDELVRKIDSLAWAAAQEREYTALKGEWVLRAAALREPLQMRFLRFLEAAETDRNKRTGLAYELFILEEAEKFCEWAESDPAQLESTEPWAGDLWKRLEESGIASKDHSNNTFAAAVGLARRSLTGEEI